MDIITMRDVAMFLTRETEGELHVLWGEGVSFRVATGTGGARAGAQVNCRKGLVAQPLQPRALACALADA